METKNEFKFATQTPHSLFRFAEAMIRRPRMYATTPEVLEGQLSLLLSLISSDTKVVSIYMKVLADVAPNLPAASSASFAWARRSKQPWLTDEELIEIVAQDFREVLDRLYEYFKECNQEIPQ